jgi:hypothetical protein
MAIIENKVHAFWVLPKDGDEYRQLGVVVGPHPEMDQEFIFYSKRKFNRNVLSEKTQLKALS